MLEGTINAHNSMQYILYVFRYMHLDMLNVCYAYALHWKVLNMPQLFFDKILTYYVF